MPKPSEKEIEDQENEAAALAAEGESKFPGMTFEEGVSHALRWVRGDEPDPPMAE